ncbi:MAG: hypothetical protein WCF67_15775 [Chitinophagaceae bacterium]
MSKQQQLQPGFVEFYDNETPGLQAAHYVISSTLSLPNADTNNYSQTVTQDFIVAGPQFTIDPKEIHAMFPGNNANGDFSEVLPSLVMENPALPWERAIGDDNTIPWLALIVCRANELTLDAATNSPLLSTTVADFLKEEKGILKPHIDTADILPNMLTTSMNSILISTEVFRAVMPRLVELSTLTHLREVNPEDKAANEKEDRWYSVILANRFPKSNNPNDDAGVVNYVHLVSVEGLTQYLVDNPEWPVGIEKLQLASLASWQFTSAKKPGQTFAELATHLITAAGNDPSSLLLRIPVTNDGSAAAKRLLEGYTALSFHTASGEDSFCWYRGPFSAVQAQPLPATITDYKHVSTATIYDQANAIFDNSYSSAWTIGRLIAISDSAFADALLRARTKVTGIGTRLLERSKMAHLAGIIDLEKLASPGLTRRSFTVKMKTGMGVRLMQSFAQPMQDIKPTESHSKNFLYPGEQQHSSHAAEMTWFMQKKEIKDFLAAKVADAIDPLADWLSKLALLYNVSFNHLVPDQRMLPVESVRFFHIDQGWIHVMLNGAMTVGLHGTRELNAHNIIAPSLLQKALHKIKTERNKRLRMSFSDEPITKMPVAGMLIRSALITGWPGLAINATSKAGPVNIMRMDNVSPNVLLVLWDAVLDTVTISQPEQGLIFGVEDGWIIPRRNLDSVNLGAKLPDPHFPAQGDFNQYMRTAANGIGDLVLNLVPAVKTQKGYLLPDLSTALAQSGNLKPSQFAIEMVKAPEKIVFNPPH